MPSDGTLFELVPITGKGMGLRATVPIPKGTRIMGDKALITFDLDEAESTLANYIDTVWPKVAKLKEKHRASYNLYMTLANIYPDDGKIENKEAGIARTSSILLQTNPDRHAVFPNAARLNHSCNPNAYYSWNEAIGRLTVHAVRDIKEGEEITIHYHLAVETQANRQHRHALAFRFICQCAVCVAPLPARRQRDNLLCVLRKHLDVFDSGRIDEIKLEDGSLALRHSRELIEVAEAVGMSNTIISDALREAAMTCIFNSDQARANIFAQKAYETRLVLEGPDSVNVKKLAKFAKNPANYKDFGITDDWKSKPQDIPTDMTDTDFEMWLWRIRDDAFLWTKSNLRPILGDFSDEKLFPLFGQIPAVNELDPRYWHLNGTSNTITALKFWALLGEIVSVDITDRLKLIVKDKIGTTFPVTFQTPNHGIELGIPSLRIGNAIAIISAERRMMPGEVVQGIIQRRAAMTKVSLKYFVHMFMTDFCRSST